MTRISFLKKYNLKDSFTIQEVLIVIGVIALLSVATVGSLNATEYLRRGRDNQRAADMATLQTVLARYKYSGAKNATMGSVNTLYISLPDTSSTCSALGLPALPSGWSYRCANSTNYRKLDGAGWIPVDFSSLSGTSLSSLPLDPTNNSNYFYAYAVDAGGRFVLAALFESEKQTREIAAKDGGSDDGRLEMGDDLSLWIQASGLVGYWKLDEGSGTVASNSSDNNYNGTLAGPPSWQSESNCARGKCLNFNPAAGDRVDTPNVAPLNFSSNGTFSIALWIKPDTLSSSWRRGVIVQENYLNSGYRLGFNNGGQPMFWTSQSGGTLQLNSSLNLSQNQWSYIVVVYNNQLAKIYFNGAESGSSSGTYVSGLNYGRIGGVVSEYFSGMLDEVRFYSRPLSSAEVKALYNSAK